MRLAAALAALVLASVPRLAEAQPRPLASAAATTDWPCPGCIVRVPPRLPDGPRPLLVALHGDGGGVRPLVRAWQAACDEAGVILLAPRCPRELGCTAGSWWQWLTDARHRQSWLGDRIDEVAARYPIDPARVYATGYSGGATYLGWYAPTFPRRFAAVAHVAGGARYGPPCPSCKVPVLFVIGGLDPMIGPYTGPLRQYYEACGGHEVEWQQLPGVTHEGIVGLLQAGRAKDILAWLLARPAACAAEVPADAGIADAEAPDAGAPDQVVPDAAPPAMPISPAPARVPPPAGCGCGLVAEGERGAPVAVLAVLLTCKRRRGRGRVR
jgi:predicted esterase